MPTLSGVTSTRQSLGYTLIEVLIAVALIAVVSAIALLGVSATGKTLDAQRTFQRGSVAVDNVSDRLYSSATSSLSVFLPTSCGGSGSGDGTSCNEVRFLGRDASGTNHIWGWSWSSADGSLSEYKDFPTPDSPLSQATLVDSVSGFTGFSATPESASDLATSTGVSSVASRENLVLSTALDPNGRVVSGNRVVNVSLSMSGQSRFVTLLSRDASYSEDVVNFQIKTPDVATTMTCGDPSCAFTFASSTAVAHTSSFSDLNFGQYVPYLGGTTPWTNTACTNAYGVTVATLAPGIGSGDSYSIVVTPALYGTCSFTVSNAAGVSATETITVGGSPGDSLTLTPSSVSLGSDSLSVAVATETGTLVSGNYAVFPDGTGSAGFSTTCPSSEVGYYFSGSTLTVTTVGLTPPASALSCTLAVYDTGDYSASNPYTSNLISMLSVNVAAGFPGPTPTPASSPTVPGATPTPVGSPTPPGATPPAATPTPVVVPCVLDAKGYCSVISSRFSNVISNHSFCPGSGGRSGYYYDYLTGSTTLTYDTYNVASDLGQSTLTIDFYPASPCGTKQTYSWGGLGNPSTVFSDLLLPNPALP